MTKKHQIEHGIEKVGFTSLVTAKKTGRFPKLESEYLAMQPWGKRTLTAT